MLTKVLNKFQTQTELVGLDIGTASVKLVQLLKDKDGYTAVGAVREAIQPGGDDAKTRSGATVDAVKRCLKKVSLSTRNVVCGISGPDVMVRGFNFPPLPDEAVDQAVRFEVRQVCPFESKDMVLDYQLIGNGTSEPAKGAKPVPRSGVMVACTEQIIKDKVKTLTEADAKALLVDTDALATLNCLNELNILTTHKTVAVIDVGWTLTNVVIYGHDGLPFVRDLATAGRQVIEKVSCAVSLPQEAVRQALAGGETDVEIKSKILLALNNAVRPLASAINETLRFYSFQEKKGAVEKIFLCGGFSLLDTFMEFFADALPVDVQLLNPFEHIKCRAGDEGNELLSTEGSALVVATGLAMRTL